MFYDFHFRCSGRAVQCDANERVNEQAETKVRDMSADSLNDWLQGNVPAAADAVARPSTNNFVFFPTPTVLWFVFPFIYISAGKFEIAFSLRND